MRKFNSALILSVLTLALAAPAFAADSSDTSPMQGRRQAAQGAHHGDRLAKMDTDGDGKVSEQEFAAGVGDRFKRLDKNGDGYITKDDMPEHPKGEGRRGGMGGGLRERRGGGGGGDTTAPEVTTEE